MYLLNSRTKSNRKYISTTWLHSASEDRRKSEKQMDDGEEHFLGYVERSYGNETTDVSHLLKHIHYFPSCGEINIFTLVWLWIVYCIRNKNTVYLCNYRKYVFETFLKLFFFYLYRFWLHAVWIVVRNRDETQRFLNRSNTSIWVWSFFSRSIPKSFNCVSVYVFWRRKVDQHRVRQIIFVMTKESSVGEIKYIVANFTWLIYFEIKQTVRIITYLNTIF